MRAVKRAGGSHVSEARDVIELSSDDEDASSSRSSSSGAHEESTGSPNASESAPRQSSRMSAPAEGSVTAAADTPACCILVAASTNVAVDRVLLGLQAAGFTDFARVGAVRKCAKAVLPHLLPYEDNAEARTNTLNDMRALLSEPSCGGQDRDAVAEAVHRLQVWMWEDSVMIRYLSSFPSAPSYRPL